MGENDVLSDVKSDEQGQWRRWARGTTLAIFGLLVLAGLFGAFDQNRTVTQTKDGIAVTIEYPYTTRAGADVALDISVDSTTELPETLDIVLHSEYTLFFEDFAVSPAPSDEHTDTADRHHILVTTGQSYSARVIVDGRAADAWSPSYTGTVNVGVGDSTSFEFSLKTWRLP